MINVIGIVGQGFVGNAVNAGMSRGFPIKTYDVIPEKSNVSSLEELCQTSDVVFVCLPTPMKKSGECDLSIVDGVLNQINSFGSKKMVILKSTVPPGSCDRLQEKYDNIDLMFNPEFLTEANAVNDFINQDRIIVGGRNKESLLQVRDMFKRMFDSVPIMITDCKSAEMVKYITNCFLSVKVTFANQIYDLCKSSDVNYSDAIKLATLDKRLGYSHWMVPGPDGDRGYGGHCFPKDMSAFLYFGEQNGVNLSLIRESISYNDNIRTDRDWEGMKGRAVSDD
jgi:UDPglucose 6-dehydrogenase